MVINFPRPGYATLRLSFVCNAATKYSILIGQPKAKIQPEVNRVPLKSSHLFDRLVVDYASSRRAPLVKNCRYPVFNRMKFVKILAVVVAASCTYAAREGCDVPLSKKDKSVKFNASSYATEREPYRARFDQPWAWCPKTNIRYKEYFQVDFGSLRHVSAIELQGAEWSYREFFVKTFFVSYSIDGVKWKFYKRSGSKGAPWTIFNGNTDVSHRSLNEIHPSFVARHVRINPVKFKNSMCMKVEVYGCNKTIDCTHVIKLGQDQKVTINTPSYPLPYRNDAHCNWLVFLPSSQSSLSIVAMDFDVGGSTVNQTSCTNEVVRVYHNHHSFSKYLVGSYCNHSLNLMPRESKLSTDSLRISFTGGDNHISRHRGFSILLWSSQQDYKTAKACYNSTITLDCINAEQDIEVISAYYGRRANAPICSAENGTTMNNSTLYTDSCKAPDVLPKLQTICDYRNICRIEINDETFPHDCTSGGPLEMFVVYQCNITKPVTTTPPPSTTTIPPTTTSKPVEATEPKKTPTDIPHLATTKILAKSEGQPIILIAAVGGGVFMLIMIIIAIITCICCRKRNNEKADLNKKGVVPSESTQSKGMVESDSLYEKIDELVMEPVRYCEAEPNRYSPLHGTPRGMSDNPLYQSGGPTKPNSSYDVPNSARHHQNHLHRPHSVGKPLRDPSAPESTYIDVLMSPEELPSNSPPITKYLVPSGNSPPEFCVSIPLEQYSDSDVTPKASPAGGDDVYEAMDGSNA